MDELVLMYLGKKKHVTIQPDYLPEPLMFPAREHTASLREDLAKRLIQDNPKMFLVVKRISSEEPLSEEAKEALFSDEGLEGVEEQPKSKPKPLSQMNKTDLARYAAEQFELFLDPDDMTKAEMLAAIAKAQE